MILFTENTVTMNQYTMIQASLKFIFCSPGSYFDLVILDGLDNVCLYIGSIFNRFTFIFTKASLSLNKNVTDICH